jgi:hypothetical protein
LGLKRHANADDSVADIADAISNDTTTDIRSHHSAIAPLAFCWSSHLHVFLP